MVGRAGAAVLAAVDVVDKEELEAAEGEDAVAEEDVCCASSRRGNDDGDEASAILL